MTVRWSERATQHLEDIYDYIAQDKPEAARGVIEKLVDSAEALGQNPQMGRPSRHLGQRELVRAPFIVFYAIEGDVIDIRAVLHGKRKW